MHPINHTRFGVNGIAVSFYNGTSVTNGYIVKQIGTKQFIVSDGTHTKTVSLAKTTSQATSLSSNPTLCTILINPPSTASGATFTVSYSVDSAAVVSGGSGFAANDVLALAGTNGATATAATVNGSGVIQTATVSAAGSGVSALPANPITGTRATGTGATFTAHYGVDSATLNAGGTGYAVGNTLALTGTTSGTIVVDTVDGSGVIQTFHVGAVGDVTSLLANPVSVTGGAGSGAKFNLKYKVNTVASSGGSNYKVNDKVVFTGITATTQPVAHLSSAGSAPTVVIDNAGAGITVAASAVSTAGLTATFTLKYKVATISSSGGTGYAVNDKVSFNGMVATTLPTAHISASTNTAATTTALDTAGSGITVAATSIGADLPAEYVAHIYDGKCVTTAGNTYKWSIGTHVNGSSVIGSYS